MSKDYDHVDLSIAKVKVKPCCRLPGPNFRKVSDLTVSPESDYYNMVHKKRGKAIIFNQNLFDDRGLAVRTSSNLDMQSLMSTFEELKFDVHCYEDLKYGQIYDIITDTAAEDHTDTDCLVVVVMSHGGMDKIHAMDQKYDAQTLWMPFSGKDCPSLAGKPKLFFIQACRGDKVDEGVKVKHDASNSQSYILPSMADFLVMYSSAEGYKAYRSPISGSWFIQTLCLELTSRANHQDLLTILTFVNRKLALDYESKFGYKQVGSIISSLTRLLHFFPIKEQKIVTAV